MVSLVSKKILFITEGPVDELHLMKSICKDLCLKPGEFEFYSYKTDFHQFARLMLPDDKSIDDDIDVLLALRANEKDLKMREILSYKYTDIYIIFDFDPHTVSPEFEKIKQLASYFTDSSDMGRLFINYPMMQSYRHLKSLPDTDYENRAVTIEQIRRYKDLVSHEGFSELIQSHTYNHVQLYEIAYHNYCKREKILGRKYTMPDVSTYDIAEDVKLLDLQLLELREAGQCKVLNTSSLIYLDYKPKQFFEEITRHKNRFRI